MQRRSCAWVLLVTCLLLTTPASQADWTRFRGPSGSGISSDSVALPVRWSPSANVKWKTALPGPGVSCPIVVGDSVYVTCYSSYGIDREKPGDQKNLKRHLVRVDRKTGQVKWDKQVDAVLPEDPYQGVGVPAHGYASHTPVSDGENVYVFFGKTGALAFDQNGKQLWHTRLGKESDPRRWGSASSPILYQDLLIVPATAESEALVALDKKTGKEVWRQEAAGFASTWSTPVMVKAAGREDLVISVVGEIWGFNPQTGKLRWYCTTSKSNSVCSSVVVHDGVVYGIEGRSGGAIAVRAGGKGDVTQSHVLWTGKDSSRFSSPLVHNGRVYSIANGVASVLDASSGERLFQTRLEGPGGDGGRMGGDYGSPVLADGKIYFIRNSGDMFVMKANDKLEPLAINRLADGNEVFSATPAISNGELFIRSDKNLYCVAALGHEVPDSPVVASAQRPADEAGRAGGGDGRGERGDRGGRGGRERRDPARMFERWDADADGKLSGDEIPERMRNVTEQIDTDKDGAITLEEFRNGRRQMFGRGGRGGRGGDSREGKPERPQRPELE